MMREVWQSMMKTIPKEVCAAFSWWLGQLAEENAARSGNASLLNAAPVVVKVESLTVAQQQDNNSCAVLFYNGLMHHYAPGTTLLLNGGDNNSLVLERIM